MATHGPSTLHDSTVRVVHHVRGRLRLRIPGAAGELLSEALREVPGIRSVAWSPRTRSLLVLYAPEITSAAAILEALGEHADLDEHAGQSDDAASREQPPTVTAAVVGTMSEIDRRVRRSTAGALGLGALIPGVLMLWAVGEIARGRVAPLSWSSALWYAHGLFRDYNPPS